MDKKILFKKNDSKFLNGTNIKELYKVSLKFDVIVMGKYGGNMIKPEIKIDSITLAVSDLKKSIAFYDGLGLPIPTEENQEDHIVIELQDNLILVLYLRSELDVLANQSNVPEKSSDIILSFIVESKMAVDSILEYVITAGGSILPNQPKEDDDGYSGHFKDPDGHIWEVVFYSFNDY